MRNTKRISISILPGLLEKADRLAKEESRTRSSLFAEAIKRYIEEKEWQKEQRFKRLRKEIEKNELAIQIPESGNSSK